VEQETETGLHILWWVFW